MEESHSNLPTSHLLGSVPAVVSEEKSTTTYEVPEAIMQTFPPNNNRGGGSSHGYQTLGNLSATFSEKVTRTVRKFSPHLAAKMRPPHMPVIRGRPSSKKSVFICGQPRGVFVFLFSAVLFCGSLLALCCLLYGHLASASLLQFFMQVSGHLI
ncbi:PRA1 family protein A2 isoform X4 [Manihot esculenta]|uniref:PRA1 family protein A2 isoform X4 n=1 Tax=Manihot esculenta TaxID=3983 RepID=UPI001CC531F5|nr:PRA1 family protein A2 isoform X4 [Manihot esculenta]